MKRAYQVFVFGRPEANFLRSVDRVTCGNVFLLEEVWKEASTPVSPLESHVCFNAEQPEPKRARRNCRCPQPPRAPVPHLPLDFFIFFYFFYFIFIFRAVVLDFFFFLSR